MALVYLVGFFERCVGGIAAYAAIWHFMHVYSIFDLRLFLSILLLYLVKSGIETPDQNRQWYQHLLTLVAFFFLREQHRRY